MDSLHQMYNKDRIYIGWKSSRLELKKIMNWIKANDSILTKLNIISWYGKGFKKFRTASPNYSYHILDNYIDTSKILTRPIGRMDSTGQHPWYEQHNSLGVDSAFYDITLLKDTTRSIDSVFFIGIQNRRTDPLVRPIDNLQYSIHGDTKKYSQVDSSMKFYSTAEFDINVAHGAYIIVPDATYDTNNVWIKKYDSIFEPPSYWRNLWWRRLGCREINLKFNYYVQNNPSRYCLLHVSELGAHDSTLNSQAWHQEPLISLLKSRYIWL
jgi:hypothetical protein